MASTGMDPNIFVTKTELTLQLALLRAEIKSDMNEVYKWLIPIFGGQTIALLGALYAWTH